MLENMLAATNADFANTEDMLAHGRNLLRQIPHMDTVDEYPQNLYLITSTAEIESDTYGYVGESNDIHDRITTHNWFMLEGGQAIAVLAGHCPKTEFLYEPCKFQEKDLFSVDSKI